MQADSSNYFSALRRFAPLPSAASAALDASSSANIAQQQDHRRSRGSSMDSGPLHGSAFLDCYRPPRWRSCIRPSFHSRFFRPSSTRRRIANFLLMTTQIELRRMQEHSLLISRDAKGRLASFLIDLSERMGTQTWLDLPMSHLDIADHLGLTIETLSRIINQMENSGVIVRGRSVHRLFLNNRQALTRMAN
jgi:DNA-binding MarR family transcriptional regulator